MKRTVITALLLCMLLPSLHGQGDHDFGREPARTLTLSYRTVEEAAMRSREASLYYQPLSPEKSGANFVYETPFKIPFDWVDRQQFLHIGRADRPYRVFINDALIALNTDPLCPAEFDITNLSQEGMNRLRIELITGHRTDSIFPAVSPAGGIMGEVFITSQPRVRIRDFETLTNFETEKTTLQLGVILKTHLLNRKNVRVWYELMDPAGNPVANGHRDATIDMRKEDTVRFFITVPDAKGWSHESPYLYTLVLRTQQDGRYNDHIAYRIGLRSVDHRDGKIFLNGKPVEIHAFELTTALPPEQELARLETLKKQGYNTVNLTHGPREEWFYDLCDHTGIYVINRAAVSTSATGTDIRKGGNITNDPRWEEEFTSRALDSYLSARNHPSVVIMSPADNSLNGNNLYESYLALKNTAAVPIFYRTMEWNTDGVMAADAVSHPQAVGGRFIVSESPSRSEGRFAVEPVNTSEGTFRIKNGYAVKPLQNARISYTVRQGSKKVSEGVIETYVPAAEEAVVTIPHGKAKGTAGLTYELTLSEIIPDTYYRPPFTGSEGTGSSGLRNLIKRNPDDDNKTSVLFTGKF